MLDTRAIRALALAASAEQWHDAGVEHPLGAHFNGPADFVPGRYDHQTLDRAIAAVPPGLMATGPLLWGTPEQASRKLAALAEAGLREPQSSAEQRRPGYSYRNVRSSAPSVE